MFYSNILQWPISIPNPRSKSRPIFNHFTHLIHQSNPISVNNNKLHRSDYPIHSTPPPLSPNRKETSVLGYYCRRNLLYMERSKACLNGCRQVKLRVTGPRTDTVLRSRATDRTDAVGSSHDRKTTEERILRYPNGDTRLIRYPVTEVEEDEETDSTANQLFGLVGGHSPLAGTMRTDEKSKQAVSGFTKNQ